MAPVADGRKELSKRHLSCETSVPARVLIVITFVLVVVAGVFLAVVEQARALRHAGPAALVEARRAESSAPANDRFYLGGPALRGFAFGAAAPRRTDRPRRL